MFRSLSAGAIGIKATLAEAVEMAARHGFQGLHLSMAEAADMGVAKVKAMLGRHGLRASAWGLPLRPERSEEEFQKGLAELRRLAPLAAELGCLRCSTWILSFSDDADYHVNYERHRVRLGEAAAVLKPYGIRLALEFLGPRTLWSTHRYTFIHTMEGMLRLCQDIGTGNVGLLLDAWHWHTSHATVQDLARLSNADVVDVHINDAPAGVPTDELVDNVRCLPGDTGVIDISGFLKALDRLGYDGPVMVEPFSQKLREMPAEQALAATRASLDRVWRQAGLA